MHPVRKQRLILVGFIVGVSSLAALLIGLTIGDNANAFYSTSEVHAGLAPLDRSFRAGGCVVPGSLHREEGQGLDVRFDITDGVHQLPVFFDSILPDLFAEGEAVIMTGRLNDEGEFQASQVLAKHDETYVPPEVAESMSGPKYSADCQMLVSL